MVGEEQRQGHQVEQTAAAVRQPIADSTVRRPHIHLDTVSVIHLVGEFLGLP